MAGTIDLPLAFLTGSPPDWIILFIVALIIFGPKRLPEVGQQLGKALREFRKVADEVTGATRSVHEEITSATGRLRAEVEATAHHSPTRYDQRSEELMASSPRAASSADPRNLDASRENGAGLKLSTLPGESVPDADGPAEPKG